MARRPIPLPAPRLETADERAERRRKLLRLDRCLDVLEAAMERDCTVVQAREAAVLSETTLMLHEGMAVPDAIEVILLLQEAYMLPLNPPAEPRRPPLAKIL